MLKNMENHDDVEVDNLEYIDRIDSEVDNAFFGLLPDYHTVLGKRLAHAIGVWVPPEHLEDVLCDIRYARALIDRLVYDDVHRDRRPKPS